jgi:retinol dehydrogenase 12
MSMQGKTVIITGGNAGIGKETALGLAKLGARIILACRNLETANQAKGDLKNSNNISKIISSQFSSFSDEIFAETQNPLIIVKCVDMSHQESIRNFAADIHKTEPKIDVLILNAGIALSLARYQSIVVLQILCILCFL